MFLSLFQLHRNHHYSLFFVCGRTHATDEKTISNVFYFYLHFIHLLFSYYFFPPPVSFSSFFCCFNSTARHSRLNGIGSTTIKKTENIKIKKNEDIFKPDLTIQWIYVVQLNADKLDCSRFVDGVMTAGNVCWSLGMACSFVHLFVCLFFWFGLNFEEKINRFLSF